MIRLSLFKVALILLVVVFSYLQYVLWFEEDGIFDMIHLKKQLAMQLQWNDQLKQRNQELYQQVERLKSDPQVTEGRARGELGMIKKGETFYQIVK
jgi:cell division protein FtsB